MATAATNPALAHAGQAAYTRAATGAYGMVMIDVVSMTAAANRVASRDTAKQLVALGNALGKTATNNTQTATINRRIVKKAQTATVNSYAAYRRNGGPRGYRKGEGRHPRYSGGALADVLKSPDFIYSDSRTIGFINVGILDQRAKQWARLNFGAGARGVASPGSRRFAMRISNVIVADLGLDGGPSKPFTIPRGYFTGSVTDAAGSGAFYLPGEGPTPGRITMPRRKPTLGIRAEHFLDNGIAMIAREFWPNYQRHLKTLVEQGAASVRPTNSVATNKIPAKAPRGPRLGAH